MKPAAGYRPLAYSSPEAVQTTGTVAYYRALGQMDEAKKTNIIRGEEFKLRYLPGRVIDIGCGPDLVAPHAAPDDLAQGDAQWSWLFFEAESFDCVHSSHCLGHMKNVEIALCNWWAPLVKPGGYLVIVVPDEDRMWPSLFNSDHKTSSISENEIVGHPYHTISKL